MLEHLDRLLQEGSWVSCPAPRISCRSVLGCPAETPTIPWEQRSPTGKLQFITPNETLLPSHLIAPLSARGDTWKQQRYSEAGDQKFLPSFEVSVFLCCFVRGKKNKQPHSPQEGHKVCCFSFPCTDNYQRKFSTIDSNHSKLIP